MTKRRKHAEPIPRWTPAEEAQLIAQYPHMHTRVVALMLGVPVHRAYNKAHQLGLKKTPEYFASDAAARIRLGFTPGAKRNQFPKGNEPWNKGAHYVAGGRSAETRFRKGHKPHTWRPVGSMRVNSEGYLDIKIDDTAKGPRAWMAVHRLNWIAAHGPIPKGKFVRFKDGDPRNPLVENLELVDRATHLFRNYHGRYPIEVRRLVQLRGALQRQINKRERA